MPRLMGMPIDAVTTSAAVQQITDGVAHRRGGTVLTPNVDVLRQYLSSSGLRSAFEHTDLLVADGMPLVVALRVQRTPVPEQITGTDLLWAVSAEAAARGSSVLLAGGRPGEAERAAERLRQHLPGLRAEAHPCYVRPDTEARELAELSRILVASGPDIVFLGLPFRTQVAVMDDMSAKLPATWFVGVGSSFELVNGDRTRGPRFLQRLCLEWAWRLTHQPRLSRRYLVEGMPTAARLAGAALRARWGREPDRRAVPPPRTARRSRLP